MIKKSEGLQVKDKNQLDLKQDIFDQKVNQMNNGNDKNSIEDPEYENIL